jgi:hypothetical protein
MMLTATCDVCQQTMSLEDNQAGITVQCKECGRGWVRVAPVEGIAESASAISEREPTSQPETVMSAHRPMTLEAPDVALRLVAGACPRCGSSSFTKLKPKGRTTPAYDRECKECGIRYMTVPAPISRVVQAAMSMSGVLLILGGVVAVVVWLVAAPVPGGGGLGFSRLYGVIISVALGFKMLRIRQQAAQARDQRLSEYKASAPPDTPPPVELPRAPDIVFLSIWFGTAALVAPLVSVLLLAVVFGPAAIVCGIVARAQGYLKGLIGVALGIAGLIVWGLVFVFVFLS